MLTALLLPLVMNLTREESFFTIWMQGSKVGYSSYANEPTTFHGKPAEKSISKTEIKIGLIGSNVEMSLDSETIAVSGKPVQMHFSQSSSGRSQTMNAWFEPSGIRIEVNNNGTMSKQTLTMPKDGDVVDDPVAEFALKPHAVGASKIFYILDPSTVSLVKNKAKLLGKRDVDIKGVKISANAVLIEDTRMNTTVFTSGKGDVIKVTTTIGMDMLPATKEEALGKIDTSASPDMAALMSIKPSKAINEPLKLSNLKIRLNADNIPTIPSDSQQRARKELGSWIVNVKPTQLSMARSVSIATAKGQKPDWVKPSMLMPSNSPRFVKLAREIIAKKTDVRSAALAIRRYVNSKMIPNAGIGVLRDANEVLDAKEGVCRDYAILTTSLCRAANIPARLASGLVNFEGNFYYHAWVEVWTGYDWLGLDSVPPSDFFTASHVKLSQGNVNQAFTFTILSNAKMDVLEQRN
jgi:hypothetical protein